MLGEGRMLLAFGPGRAGLHLFWLGAGGFETGAFVAADAFPEPIVRARGEGLAGKIEVIVSWEKKATAREMLWWGL